MSDYILSKDTTFDPWFEYLKNYVVEKVSSDPPAWTHIPAELLAELTAAYTAWGLRQNPGTPMGIPNHSESHTPVPVPQTSPRLITHYRDEKSERRGKPQGVHGIEVRWAIPRCD